VSWVPGTTEPWMIPCDAHHPVCVHIGYFQVPSFPGQTPMPNVVNVP
jgi:hypothetical protein